ncbi:MAG: hypothetical protein ING59_05335 [Burkholderiales bacterium]|nr:hypothetical protein [Burkholderiales bacterium]
MSPRSAALTAAALLLAGCASVPSGTFGTAGTTDPVYSQPPVAEHLVRQDDTGRCARLLRDADHAIDAAGLRDAMTTRVPGFPYLRVDRLTAALAPASTSSIEFVAWSHLLAQLDQNARRFELANAPPESTRMAVIELCRTVLANADDLPQWRAALLTAARVPDDYSTGLRALGLYPLTRHAFAAGVQTWQKQTSEVFALPLGQLPQLGRLVRYAPSPAAPQPMPALAQAPHLGLPIRSDAALQALVLRHAPLLDVDTATGDDRIGSLRWEEKGEALRVTADSTRPAAYVRFAHTLIDGRPHLQIVYAFWFNARPAASAVDPLAGALDGILWRVTLDARGDALVYDSIHPCGCYHKFFATSRVQPRPAPRRSATGEAEGTFDETLFMPQASPVDVGQGERVLLRVASRTHYLQRVLVVPRDAALPDAQPLAYALRDDDELRSLPLPDASGVPADAGAVADARRSVFGPEGFIDGTERAERFYFWPMGIDSAGQMRQWGRHATAFVGRRHFDDATLIDRYFEVLAAPAVIGQR